MPIYEYLCNSCEKAFEALQKFTDEPLTSCQLCGKKDIVRKLSLSAFQLKGGSWYHDGYHAKTNQKSSKDKSDQEKPHKTAPTKQETKSNPAKTSASTTPSSSTGASKQL